MLEIEWTSQDPPSDVAQLLVVPVAQGRDRNGLGAKLDIAGLEAALEAAHYRAKPGETFKLSRQVDGCLQQVALIGVGADTHDASVVRRTGYEAARAAVSLGVRELILDLDGTFDGVEPRRLESLLATGLELGTYRYERFIKDEQRRPNALTKVTIRGRAGLEGADTRRGQVVAAAVARARDLANGPAELVTPSHLAEHAQRLASDLVDEGHDVECTILERDDCERLGMGCFLGVARGSDTPPKFIHLRYRPKTASRGRVCLVGKGVTFDSGGYSLKPSEGMLGMKLDMSGAATVLGAFDGAVRLGVSYELHAISAATENMVSGRAYRLGDVLIASNGTSVEINNTDAEGRLTLADALIYAGKLEPDFIIDFATLTGACVIALGPHIAGTMSNDDVLTRQWHAAADAAGEQMWRLPLPEALMSMLDSKIADLRNTGERSGGALTAGLFLQQFVEERPWLHVDLAGPAMCEKPFDVNAEGGTGFGVATTLELLERDLELSGAASRDSGSR